ncbi:MAG TPA: CcmD family protein [Candidatus Acidoferrales bacterium]|nr:CcmD family protein [Candidatus Acidoferrales bacterium]
MKNFWSILIAYLAAWAIFFGYYASVGRRLARLEAELRRLSDRAPKS